MEAYRIKNVFQSSKDFRAATFAALSSRELDRLRSRMGLSSYATCALPEKKLAKRFLWACLLPFWARIVGLRVLKTSD